MKNRLMRAMTLVLAAYLSVGCLCCLVACDSTHHQGSDKEPVATAVRSLPGCYGEFRSTTVEVMETDGYGRILFAYHESSCLDGHMIALCIMQKSEKSEVYYLRG